MEKKLAVIVDNKEVTTEIADTEMCSSACDVAMETCSSQSHDACWVCCVDVTGWKVDVRVIFEGNNLDTANTDSDMMVAVMESIAQAENESRSENIRMVI